MDPKSKLSSSPIGSSDHCLLEKGKPGHSSGGDRGGQLLRILQFVSHLLIIISYRHSSYALALQAGRELVRRRNESEISSLPILVAPSIFCLRCLGCVKEQSDDRARTTKLLARRTSLERYWMMSLIAAILRRAFYDNSRHSMRSMHPLDVSFNSGRCLPCISPGRSRSRTPLPHHHVYPSNSMCT